VFSGPAQLSQAFPAAAAVAERKQISIQRLTLAWLLSLSPTLIPISGASRPESIRDSALAASVELSPQELAELDFSQQDLASAAQARAAIDRQEDEIAVWLVEN
jgi:aryl-alcohol dehydrogenase-like predicted oxidoreductase